MIDLRSLQRALGGEISGGQLLCPGPGHSPRDRSLSVRPIGDDFVVFSHSGDGWTQCKDFVRQRLGLPAWQPGDGHDRHHGNLPLLVYAGGRIRAQLLLSRRAPVQWERKGQVRPPPPL